ncbi:hypothetical protein [Sphingomonas sp. CFBP 8760]|uniref:hypothetical protein n=1 Tax=Sphingomonas sp. CFBP 8760 TaxID=2775282 RepID=UPI00177CBFD9|nr:hypothetical protein [Sphingomonas sp. CFBP 8760]MBD8548290.1 hypothetical protein [Sphingomonas sp. CFBP 8760]
MTSEDDVLWRSFANACRAGEEIDSLVAALREVLADGGLGSLRADVDTEEEYDHETGQGWAHGYCLYSFKVVPARGRAVNRGWISFGISFWRAEDERGDGWPGARVAKLYVGYSPPKAEGWSTENLVLDGTGQSLDVAPMTERRWRGTGPGGMSEAWFFCLRLVDLHSRADLEREVATPLRLLLDGRPEARAFASSMALLLPSAASA